MNYDLINVGDRVRSFDFPNGDMGFDLEGDRACYIEGTVVDIRECDAGYSVYVIEADRDVFGGNDRGSDTLRLRNPILAPVNGTPKWFGGECNGVRKI